MGKLFQDQIFLERELETSKISLIHHPDFNTMDAFKLFDPDAKGYLALSDFKKAMGALLGGGVRDVELVFKRND